MSFAKVESEIIRDADMDGSLKEKSELDFFCEFMDAVDAYGAQPMNATSDLELGRIGAALIRLCAKRDADLTTCIRKAVEK